AALELNEDIFTVVHFTSKVPDVIYDSVVKIMRLGGMYEKGLCKGLQVNNNFGKITPGIMAGIKATYPKLKIILQIQEDALAVMDTDQIIAELKRFNDIADYTLVDPSGGKGQEMDVRSGIRLANAIRKNTNIGAALAGGLSQSNIERIVQELAAGLGTDNFSIDAEGGLRDRIGEGYGNDIFNPQKAGGYFRGAVEAFDAIRSPR
ncbi:MAG: hypothetical protein KGJ13_10510, partial [Patescibacteria group bacterium]|nr:hypothetical protein [Patescibacteria group bacterium]